MQPRASYRTWDVRLFVGLPVHYRRHVPKQCPDMVEIQRSPLVCKILVLILNGLLGRMPQAVPSPYDNLLPPADVGDLT